MNADRLVAAMADARRQLNTRIPGARMMRKDGAAAWISKAPFASFNSVWLERSDAPVSAVAALLDEVAAAGVPFTFYPRPGSDAWLADLALAQGMKAGRGGPPTRQSRRRHGVAGIYIATCAERRRRQGIGSAMTAAALSPGRERGLRFGTLQASEMGKPVYERMGFTTVAEFQIFALPPLPAG
jgi:GNAT superfamily N-acetyltransferase